MCALCLVYNMCIVLFCNDTATTEIYTYGHTVSLPDALPIYPADDAYVPHRWCGAGQRTVERRSHLGRHDRISRHGDDRRPAWPPSGAVAFGWTCDHRQRRPRARIAQAAFWRAHPAQGRSEEHTSELQSLMHISYPVFFSNK